MDKLEKLLKEAEFFEMNEDDPEESVIIELKNEALLWDQFSILRRVANVLRRHGFNVKLCWRNPDYTGHTPCDHKTVSMELY